MFVATRRGGWRVPRREREKASLGGSHRPRSIELLVPICTAAVVAVKVSVGRARQQPQQVRARTLLTNALVSLAGRNSCCPSLQEPPANSVPCAIRRVGGILRRGSVGNDEENAGRNCHRDDVCASAGHVPACAGSTSAPKWVSLSLEHLRRALGAKQVRCEIHTSER